MANGFAQLGELLTGGGKAGQQNAFFRGQLQQGQVQHLSAQTQEALANAKIAQQKAKAAQDEQDATDNLADAFQKAGLADTPESAQALATVARAKQGNFESLAKGRGELQTQGFRKTLADPNASPEVRLGASMGIIGKPESPLVSAPQENVNAFAPNAASAPVVNQTPLGAASTAAKTAQANKEPAAKYPSGYEADPNNPGGVRPIKGGPKDPDAPASMGSREATYFNRMLGGANQAIADIKNIVALPIGATTGFFGVGASPGSSLLGSVKGVLTNKVASQDVQDFNSVLPGLERNLASIETAGLVPPQTFANSFSKLEMREGDTNLTKLGKLAQMRQIIEAGLEPAASNPRVSPKQLDFVNKMVSAVREAVPFTRQDVIALRRAQEKNPDATMSDIISQNGLGPKTSAKTTTAAAPASKPKTVVQNGHTYTLNEATGEYE